MEWHAETDLDGQEAVRGGHLEDLESILEHEFLADYGGGVDLDTGVGKFLLLVCEEFGLVGRLWEVKVCYE